MHSNLCKHALFCASLLLLATTAAAKPKFVTYEKFGAKGDGKTDDLEAIIAAHEWANEKGLPVKAKAGKTYYIGGAAKTAIIKTDTDFTGAKFIIDDRQMENIKTSVFKVQSYQESYVLKGVKSLHRGDTSIGKKLSGPALLFVENSHKKVYIREGLNQNNGAPQREVVVVDADGNINPRTPVVFNFDEITKITAFPIDEKILTIKGGEFTTIANQAESKYNYHAHNIEIDRSNTRVEGLTHLVTGEGDHGAPYSAFLAIKQSYNVVIKDCLMTGRKIYGTIGSAKKPVNMGSYDLSAYCSASCLWENCRQTNSIDDRRYWGTHTSNYCKDLNMRGCVLSRFDAHMGVTDVTLTDCTFGHQGVRMVGFGTIRFENVETHFPLMMSLRADYGSSWEGDIIIRNCKMICRSTDKGVQLVGGSNHGHHDFGYTCYLPSNITVDGLEIDDSAIKDKGYKGPAVFGTFNRKADEKGLLPYPAQGHVSLKGVTVKSGKPMRLSYNPKLFKGYEVEGL